ncbi:MAG: hypothetical protein MRK02_16575 [Candidatus Scalindua sp.]|nr:hypothetical protein [Candidatus Scalindua sp.]
MKFLNSQPHDRAGSIAGCNFFFNKGIGEIDKDNGRINDYSKKVEKAKLWHEAKRTSRNIQTRKRSYECQGQCRKYNNGLGKTIVLNNQQQNYHEN